MSKKSHIITSLLMASMLSNANDYLKLPNQKSLEGSAIYIPRRHKLKKKYKR